MPYHTLPEDELYSVLGSGAQGLTSEQADAHRERFGYNDISQIRKRPVFLQFLELFKNLLVIIILIAAAISIIVASVTLDFFQEYRAENAAELESLRDHT